VQLHTAISNVLCVTNC